MLMVEIINCLCYDKRMTGPEGICLPVFFLYGVIFVMDRLE